MLLSSLSALRFPGFLNLARADNFVFTFCDQPGFVQERRGTGYYSASQPCPTATTTFPWGSPTQSSITSSRTSNKMMVKSLWAQFSCNEESSTSGFKIGFFFNFFPTDLGHVRSLPLDDGRQSFKRQRDAGMVTI